MKRQGKKIPKVENSRKGWAKKLVSRIIRRTVKDDSMRQLARIDSKEYYRSEVGDE